MKLLPVLFCASIFSLAFAANTQDELAKSIAKGKTIYTENCIQCHMGNGAGVANAFPPLAKADYLLKTPDLALKAVKFGMQGKVKINGVMYDNVMPNAGLDDDEIADVMNYIQNSFGNKNPKMVTEKMVAAVKK